MKKIWLSSPHMGEQEEKYVQEAFQTNWIAPLGPHVDAFEKSIETFYQCKVHVAALSSGTAALHLALILADVKAKDVVFCQSFTFSASANPIIYQNAEPYFIDSEPTTWNMCPEQLEKAIQEVMRSGKNIGACIVVDLYGMPAKWHKIIALCQHYKIPLIEDAAEALGSEYQGQKCGSFGDFGILSFNGNKIITTSGGGALLCKNKEHAEKAKFLATQARDPAPHYEHSQLGFNYRLSNVCAGIGRGQMEVLKNRVEARRANFTIYKEQLQERFEFLDEPEGAFSNRWLSTVLCSSFQEREKIRQHLAANNIESRPLWKPMHLQPYFNNAKSQSIGYCEELFEKGLCLPSGSDLTEEDLSRIIGEIFAAS